MITEEKNLKFSIFKTIAVVMALVMAVSIFLPYLSMEKEYADYIREYDNEEIRGIKSTDLINISIFEFTTILMKAGDMFPDGETAAIICLALLITLSLFVFFTLLFALIKRPIPLLVFNILTGGIYLVQYTIYSELKQTLLNYNWGIAHYLFVIALIAIFVCSICMMVFKNRKVVIQETNNY